MITLRLSSCLDAATRTIHCLSNGIDAVAETNSAEIIPSEVLLVYNAAESSYQASKLVITEVLAVNCQDSTSNGQEDISFPNDNDANRGSHRQLSIGSIVPLRSDCASIGSRLAVSPREN